MLESSSVTKNQNDCANAVSEFNPEQNPNPNLKEILNSLPNKDTSTFIELKKVGNDGKVIAQQDFYAKGIEVLMKATDAAAGIETQIDTNHNTIIRDARNATGDFSKSSVYAQLTTVLNNARAADRMLRVSFTDKNNTQFKIRNDQELADASVNSSINGIKDKVFELMTAVQSGNVQSIDLKAVNGFLLDELKKDERYLAIDNKTLLKQLNTTKDIAALEDKKYNVVTVYNQIDSQGNEEIIYEKDIMIPPLSQESLDKLAQNRNNIIGSQKSEIAKKMVNAYYDVLQTQETIPTQNVKYLPGLRNAYVKEFVDKNDNLFAQTMHSGTVASTVEKSFANENVTHVAAIAQQINSKGLIINSLNTPVFGIEKQTGTQLTDAVENMKKNSDTGSFSVDRTITPLNKIRWFSPKKIDSYDKSLKELGKALIEKQGSGEDANNDIKIIGKYLQGKLFFGESRARRALERFKQNQTNIVGSKKQLSTLETAINAKSAVNETFLGSAWRAITGGGSGDEKNMTRSQRQTASMTALTGLVNCGALSDLVEEHTFVMPILNISCKSGKDRTGNILVDSRRRMLNVHLDLESGELSTAEKNKLQSEWTNNKEVVKDFLKIDYTSSQNKDKFQTIIKEILGQQPANSTDNDWENAQNKVRKMFSVYFAEQNLNTQINSGHIQTMASIGGTAGAIGMKNDTELSGTMYTDAIKAKVNLPEAKNNKANKFETVDENLNVTDLYKPLTFNELKEQFKERIKAAQAKQQKTELKSIDLESVKDFVLKSYKDDTNLSKQSKHYQDLVRQKDESNKTLNRQ